jgi:hypothetical protein
MEKRRYQLVENISKGLTISDSSNAPSNEYGGMYGTRWNDVDSYVSKVAGRWIMQN